MAKFTDYEIPADHPAVLSGHISGGDKVPFLVVVENDRGVGGYAFTSGGIHYVNQFKSDDDVAAEKADQDKADAKAAKEANAQAARDAKEYSEPYKPSEEELRAHEAEKSGDNE